MIAALSKHAQKSLFDGIWEAANACYLPFHAVVGELYSVCDNFSVEYQLPARNDMLCIAEFSENDHFFDLSWKPRNLLPVFLIQSFERSTSERRSHVTMDLN